MPQSQQSDTQDDGNMGTVSDLTDQDLLIQYCLQNKVNKTAIDELLKRGYDSLNALKLVNIEDLSSQHIPMGQRRLIYHIAQALTDNDDTSGQTGSKGSTASGTQGNTGVSQVNDRPVREQQPVANSSVQQTPPDLYSQTLLNTYLNQQSQLTNSASVNVQSAGNFQGQQPSWSDPQIHIASATGKSTSTFYDICDFVPHAVEEDLLVGGQGDQQLVIKSGPKKPRLESLTLSQWSVANLAILYKLVNEGKLVGPSLMDYLSYTTKVYQLVQRYSLTSILLFDREYRKLQSNMNFRWGTDVQHLHTLFLQPRTGSSSQANSGGIQKKGGNSQFQAKPRPEKRFDICRNFNSEKGCSYEQCRYKHRCIVPGCTQNHPATAHSHEKK